MKVIIIDNGIQQIIPVEQITVNGNPLSVLLERIEKLEQKFNKEIEQNKKREQSIMKVVNLL